VQAVALLLVQGMCRRSQARSWVLSLPSFEVRLGQVEVSDFLGLLGVDAGKDKEACRARFGAAVLLTRCWWACPSVCLTMKSRNPLAIWPLEWLNGATLRWRRVT
jgi:hypothetical protein